MNPTVTIGIPVYNTASYLIREKGWPCANRRLLLAIARTKLGELLAESDGRRRAGATGADATGIAHHRKIGVLFSSVLLLGSVSRGTAVRMFRRMFEVLSVTYHEGALSGVKARLGLAVRAALKVVPSHVEMT